MRGQTSWVWFMFGMVQIFFGAGLPVEYQILSQLFGVSGGGFIALAVYFLFRKDKASPLNAVSKKAERTTLIRGEDGVLYEVPIKTPNSRFTLVLNIIWVVILLVGFLMQ